MAEKTPVRVNYDGSNNAVGFAEYQAADFIGIDDGGTGAVTAAAARTALGIGIGVDVQAYDSDLATIAGLTHADGSFLVSNGSAWTLETGATVRTSLGLGTTDTPTFNGLAVTNNVTISGNLTVDGTQTILNTETLTVDDNTIVLNNNVTGSPSENAGIEIERGSSANKSILWDESNDYWTVGSDTFVAGAITGALSATSTIADGVTATTQSASDNSTKVATTAYVDTQVSTNEEIDDRVAALLIDSATSGIDINYDDANNQLTISTDLGEITADLTERVDDQVNTLLTAGSNVSLTYDDAAGTLTIASTDTNTQLTTEQVQDIVGGMVDGGTETNVTVTYDDTNGRLNFVVDQLTSEQVQDIIGPMFASNTETFIDVAYDDSDGTLDLVVPVKDEDNMASDSATHLATQQSIKAYVDSQIQTEESIEDFVGGMFSSNTETFIAATYEDSDGTLDLVVPVLDEDNMSSDSATHLATQQSIKAYVDGLVQTEESIEDFVGGMVTGNTETLITVTYDDSDGTMDFVVDNDLSNYDNSSSGFITATLTQEQVEDYVGGMLDGDETFITVAYDDTDGNIDFTVPVKDEDNMASDSASHLATQQSIKAYVDSQIQTEESIEDFVGGMVTGNTETLITVTYEDSDGTMDFVVDNDLANYDNTNSGFITATLTNEQVQDIVGAMFSSNTETNITATYEDGDGTIDLVADLLTEEAVEDYVNGMIVGGTNVTATYDDAAGTLTLDATDTNTQLTTEEVQDIIGGMVSSNTETNIAVTYDDTNGKLDFASTDTNTQLTQEQVEDFVGGMLDGTETLITVSYDDTDGNIDFVVDNDLANYSNTNSAFITLSSLSAGTGISYNSGTGAISSSITQYADSDVQSYLSAGTGITLSGSGVIASSITQYADSDVQSYLSGGTGVTMSGSGAFSIGQAVATTDNVTFNNLVLDGNLTVNGTTTSVESTTVTIDDPLVRYADNNSGNSVDFGWYGKYVQSSTTKYAGLVWDASTTDKFRLWSGNQAEPTTTVDVSGTGHTTGTLIANIEGDVTGTLTGSASAIAATTITGLTAETTNNDADLVVVYDDSASALRKMTRANFLAGTGAGSMSNFTLTGDSGSNQLISDGQTLDVAGGTGIDTVVGGTDTVTVNIDATVATLTGSQTLTNKTLTSPVFNTGVSGTAIKDEDNMSSDSATHLATQQSIKAYVDNASVSSEQVQDIVGAMFSSNTETGIGVTYEDGDGTIDLVVATLNQDTTGNAATATALETARTIHGVSFDGSANIDLSEVIQDTVGAMFTGNTETNITVTYEDSDGTIDLVATGNTTEQIQDIVGAMFTSNTETNITATYEDSDGTIDLVADLLTEEAVEDYVNGLIVAGANITKTYDDAAGTLTIAATGGAANAFSTIAVSGQSNVVADAATDTLTLVGGTGMTLTTNAGSDTITFASSGSSGGGSMPFTEYDGSTDNIVLSSQTTGGALPVTLAGGSSDPIAMTATQQTLTSYADADDDTKIEVERSADNDTVYIKAGGTDVITATSSGVTITNLTVSGTTTQANELKITDTLFELNADGGSLTTDAGMIVERGSTGDNAALIWDESVDAWVAGTTATDGSASSNLTVTEGDFKAKTQNQSDNSTKVATTAYVDTALGGVSSNSIGDADSDTKIQVEEGSDEDIIRADTAGQERFTVDNNVSMSARGGFFTHNATLHASETFTIASTEGTVAAGPLDVQGTVDVQGTLVVV